MARFGTRNSAQPMLGEEDAANLREQFNILRAKLFGSQVMPGTVAGLSADTAPEDIETDNAIWVRFSGRLVYIPAKTAMDISALLAGTGATVAQAKYGVAYAFVNQAAVWEVEVPADLQSWTSAIAALAQYAKSTRTLPPVSGQVPVGCVYVLENNSGAFTWGATSLATEGGVYYDFSGVPGVLDDIATFALDAGAATFSYGAGKARLGTGAPITLTGKVNVAFPASQITAVATGAVGAWIFYALADDTEYAMQLGYAYTSLAAARAAVAAAKVNPLLAHIGSIYVENESGVNFTPATTHLDATGITATFDIVAAEDVGEDLAPE